MRVAFLTPWAVDSPASWSGSVAPMAESLRARVPVDPIETSGARTAWVDRVAAGLIGRTTGAGYLVGHALATARVRRRQAAALLADSNADVILAVAASQDIAYLRDPRPIVQVTDATVPAILGFYPLFTGLHPLSVRQALRMEKRAHAVTSAFVVASHWAAESLVRDCGVSQADAHVAPFGPGIAPTGQIAPAPCAGRMRFLTVTSNWERKGGRTVLDAVEQFRSTGPDASLTIVGEAPDSLPLWATCLGRVPRERMAAVYAEHDVLIELASANAAGMTLTDAHAFGLPAVATLTGGTASIIEDGVTGRLLVPGPDLAARAADALAELADPRVRAGVSARAENRFRSVLNWDAWAETVLDVCASVLGQRAGFRR